ncbi:MAG: zf-HC2 domain-containing protein, partial [Nitrospiria bacterium]
MEDLSNKNKKALLREIPALKTDDCLDTNLIGLYLEKKLSAGESGKVEEHIKECLYCLNQLNGLHEMILFEKTAEPLTQRQQERFTAIFKENIKKSPTIQAPASTDTLFNSLGGFFKQIVGSFSSWNFGWKAALAMMLITVTSVYFTVRTITLGHEGTMTRISSKISHEVKQSGVKVSLLDESGRRIR